MHKFPCTFKVNLWRSAGCDFKNRPLNTIMLFDLLPEAGTWSFVLARIKCNRGWVTDVISFNLSASQTSPLWRNIKLDSVVAIVRVSVSRFFGARSACQHFYPDGEFPSGICQTLYCQCCLDIFCSNLFNTLLFLFGSFVRNQRNKFCCTFEIDVEA